MIKLIFGVMAICCVALHADFPSHNLTVINICNATNNDLDAVMLGNHPEIAIEFSAQTTLPIHFFFKGDLVNLVENEENVSALVVQQTFYARRNGEELMLSQDLINWKPLTEFVTGSISFALSVQEGKPTVAIGSEANRRL